MCCGTGRPGERAANRRQIRARSRTSPLSSSGATIIELCVGKGALRLPGKREFDAKCSVIDPRINKRATANTERLSQLHIIVGEVEMGNDAAPTFTKYSFTMGVIDIDHCAMNLTGFDDLVEWGNVAIHAEHSIGDD